MEQEQVREENRMKPTRRRFLHAAGAAAAIAAVPRGAGAQTYPTRPMTMVVTFPPGSGSDIMARILAPRLSELLGQQVVVEAIGGGGGTTAANRVAKAAPDGYQFVLGATDTFAQMQSLYRNPPYNPVADFIPVGLIVEQPFLLVTRNGLPAANLREFIAYAKASQADMKFGSAGPASGSHLACARLNSAIGVTITAIPYRGATQGLQDVMAERIDYYCPISAAAVGHIENRTMKALAVLSHDRSELLPTLASAHEQGVTDFDASYWNGVFVPKGTPAPVVQKLHDAMVATIDTPAVQARLKEIGVSVVTPDRRSPEYLQKFLGSEIEKWADPIKASGVILD
jgi:tripartite-type tricarboxylate transporter receptor subunit TctC